MKIKFFSSFFLMIIIFFISMVIISSKDKGNKTINKFGEQCIYKNYHGIAEIKNIVKTKESSFQASVNGGPVYEGYEIKFIVQTDEKIEKEWAAESINNEHLFLLANSWYPGAKYIKKYKVKKGNKYNCNIKIIEKGTCTPVLFEIKGLDSTDFFE